MDFNPRSLTGATDGFRRDGIILVISIHAPLRERRLFRDFLYYAHLFQSTLPCGSDQYTYFRYLYSGYFNPRSLAGATGK